MRLAAALLCCGMAVAARALANGGTGGVDLPYPRSAVPTGQAGAIFVVSLASISTQADQMTLGTLQGVIARNSPRIYSIKSPSAKLQPDSADTDPTVFWLHDLAAHHGLTFDYTHLANLAGLVSLFASNITGFVAFDQASGSANTALIRCAASEGTIAAGTPAMAAHLRALGIPLVANLTGSSPAAEFERSKATLSRRGMVSQPDDGSKSQCMSDYAVFARIPTLEHDPSKHGGKDGQAFEAVLANWDQTKLSAAYGWTTDEHQFTAAATKAGGVVHASDFAYNLALLSQLPPYAAPPAPPRAWAPRPTPASTGASAATGRNYASKRPGVHLVAFVVSDGDNLQLLQGDFISSKHWHHPDRGSWPTSWSYSPATVHLMPSLLAYVRRTATVNDSLSSGPSGIGYSYPQLYTPVARELHAKATNELMVAAGMRLANVIGVAPSEQSVAALAAQANVDGIVYFTFGVADQGYAGLHGNVAWIKGVGGGSSSKPVVGLRSCIWPGGGFPNDPDVTDVEGLVRDLEPLPKDPTDPQSYSIVLNQANGNGWGSIRNASRLLERLGGFEVVLPEVLVERMRDNTREKTQCPLPSGSWAEQAGDLPKCWLPGGKSCVFECERLVDPARPIPTKCDLRHCSNISLGATKRYFLCPDGTVCPTG